MSTRLRHRVTHWRPRKKGNTPWKWFMDKTTILKKKYVQRAFFTVGHIIPELEELKKEVEITCLPKPQEHK